MFLSRPGRSAVFAALLVNALWLAAASVHAQGLLVPLPTRQSAVFDHAGRYLYISTSDGWVRRYNLLTKQLESGYNLGGSLNGLDIAPDDSFLLVAQDDWHTPNGTIHRLDLTTGTVVNINYPREFGEGGAWDVAVASNGTALVTTVFLGSGWTPVRQIDVASNTITIRTDFPAVSIASSVRGKSRLTRNAQGTHILVAELLPFFKGAIFVYDAAANTFSKPTHQGGSDNTAINPEGTLLASATYYSLSLNSTKDFSLTHVFGHLGAGVAFNSVENTLYAATVFSNEIVGYDTTTFAEKFRLPVGEPVDYAGANDVNGRLVSSPDGNYLALTTTSGIRVFRVRPQPTSVVPPVFQLADDMVFDHSGKYLYISSFRGFIWPYNLITGRLETPYNLGGIINGIDIAYDDSFLLAAQNYHGVNEGMFQRLALPSGELTKLKYDLPRDTWEEGAWDVAIASNGKALGTTYSNGSTVLALRQIDLLTNSVTPRTDATQTGAFNGFGTQVHRSADGNRLIFLDAQASNSPSFCYDASTDSFGPPSYGSGGIQAAAAVDRKGNKMARAAAFDHSHLKTLPDFAEVNVFQELTTGAAFDATKDVLYGLRALYTTTELRGYDVNTFAETFRADLGEIVGGFEQFATANMVASADGHYVAVITPTTVRVVDVLTGNVTALPTPAPPSQPYAGQLLNISTRAVVGTGDNIPIAGVVITGTKEKKLAVRGIGPSLQQYGVAGALQDPTLELYDASGQLVMKDDNWKDTQLWPLVVGGLAPEDDREAAILVTLQPGAYTVALRGKDGSSGIGLIEVYDLDSTNSKLLNISTRAFVGSGNDAAIAGIIVKASIAKVMARGVGPSLSGFGVANAVRDPRLELYNSQGIAVEANDNWQDGKAAEVWNTGLAPLDDAEAAILTTVNPGNYTAILSADKGPAGVGIVELYQLE